MNPASIGALCLLVLSVLATAVSYAQGARPDWIAREKIRAGWIYHSDGADKLAFFKKHGLNALITHAGKPEVFDGWAKEARQAGMHLIGVVGFSLDAEKAGMRRCVFGNGYESAVACPTDERFWQERMIEPTVKLARDGMTAEREISGILIDFELYANSNKGGQIYYTDACYCDACFGGFLKHKGLPDATKPRFADRKKWLKDKGVDGDYQPFLQKQVRAQATKMREAVEAVRKDFFLGYYPRPHNWMLVGVAQGLGTAEHPMILWSTGTYDGGGPSKVADNWQEEMKKQDIHCYYAGGMLLRFYSAANLAANMVHISQKGHGYWLFTVHTLCLTEDQQSGDYYLSAGTPEEYLREITRANAELDRLCADANYKTPLGFVEEPVRYRQVGFDIARLKWPNILDKSEVERGQPMALDPLPLIGGNFLMMSLKEGEDAAIRFQADKAKSGDIWGVSYAVIDADKKVLSKGRMPPGEETVVQFQAPKTGRYALVVTAGYYGRCTALSSTVPYALWTGSNFEISRPGGTVYFFVPDGMAEFSISAQCHFATDAAKLTVCDPNGAVVKDQETDPFIRSLKMTVPTGGKMGRLWSLKVAGVPKKAYRSLIIRFDPKLPPMASISPKYMFVIGVMK